MATDIAGAHIIWYPRTWVFRGKPDNVVVHLVAQVAPAVLIEQSAVPKVLNTTLYGQLHKVVQTVFVISPDPIECVILQCYFSYLREGETMLQKRELVGFATCHQIAVGCVHQ